MEALNITAIVGDKGHSHPYTCMDNSDGTNVLSVTFHPQQQILASESVFAIMLEVTIIFSCLFLMHSISKLTILVQEIFIYWG